MLIFIAFSLILDAFLTDFIDMITDLTEFCDTSSFLAIKFFRML